MGHVHLGVLPDTVKWRRVVELLDDKASISAVVTASADAAEKAMLSLVNDPSFTEALRLLGMIPLAAKGDRFGSSLRDLGIGVGDRPTLPELVMATGTWLDRSQTTHKTTTDLTELIRRALIETLSSGIGAELPGFFAATPEDVRAAAAALSRPERFSPFARQFFTALLSGVLSYYLDRTLSAHVGAGRRFRDIADREDFDVALRQHSMEATRIIREFSAGWYGKTIWREGEITPVAARGFGAIALRKITEELKRKRGVDG